MKPTRISTLLAVAVIGVAIATFGEFALATSGRPVIILPITLPIALAVLGGIIVTLAIPIRRMVRSSKAPKVDPFYATRIAMLAKASAITGAIMTGVGIGAVVYLLTRSIVSTSAAWQSAATIIGGGVLLAGGLLAEYFCRVPPSKGDETNSDEDAAKA